MGEGSKIQWTDHTFNPWIGCSHVHEGCRNCYAEAQNYFRRWNGGVWGPGTTRKVTSASNWREPLRWAREAAAAGERRKVFCASLADVLDPEAPAPAQIALWDLIRKTAEVVVDGYDDGPPMRGGLDWLLLTKRPERWDLIPADVRGLVWFGTSIADQKTTDLWTRRLQRARGFRKLFLSAEPLVGRSVLPLYCGECGALETCDHRRQLDWVIVGGESGGGARPCDASWIRLIVQQCQAAKIPVFVKQLGAKPRGVFGEITGKGGVPEEWPEDLRVREFPRGAA